MSEEKMDASPVASKASKFAWLAALITGLLSFVGLAMPLVLTHGATYDAPNWAFEEAFKRKALGAEILFGGNGVSEPLT